MSRIEWRDATHNVAGGSAFPLSRGVVAVCGSHLDHKAQIKLRDWLSEQIEKSSHA